eukprot:14741722-Alexandrium_andersonii.AAC.1
MCRAMARSTSPLLHAALKHQPWHSKRKDKAAQRPTMASGQGQGRTPKRRNGLYRRRRSFSQA